VPDVSNQSNEPHITAIVRADGTGEVIVDGERSDVRAADVAGARARVIARVAEEAAARDRPVRVATTDLDGVYALIVHPDGNVESEGAILADDEEYADGPDDHTADEYDDDAADDELAPAPSAQTEMGPIPLPPFGIEDVVDFADDEPERGPGKSFEPAPTRRSTFRAPSDELDAQDSTDVSGYRYDGAPLSAAAFPPPEVAQPENTVTGIIAAPHAAPDAGPAAETIAEFEAEFAADEPAGAQDSSGTPPGAAVFSPPTVAGDEAVPTLEDFLQSRPSAPEGPAKQGWQGFIRRITGGVISPRPGKAEQAHRDAIRRVQRSLKGPRTIVVLNPKGGAHKTTATLLLAATFGIHRGGSTLAWDNNETRGTLGWRAQPSRHSNTAVDLLRDVGRFADVESARVGYLDNYVRGQGDAQFDVLASDEDAAASSTIDAKAFGSLHSTLSRFYRLLVIDTGNNMRASNWEAAVEAADQLVVVTTVNEETAASAAWLLDGLRQKGHQDKVSQAVTILSAPGDAAQPELSQRLHAHFSALTRVVLEVPYDPGFQSGGPLNVEVLAPQTREAWLQVTAAVADGL
jgi:MinD-like ATPase involved in chromosome partitioning or flagellar assembly